MPRYLSTAAATLSHRLPVGACFGILLCLGCKTHPPLTTSTTVYQTAERSFERGELRDALNSIDQGLGLVGKGDPDSFWRFQLLKSEILIWQGNSKKALAILTATGIHEPSDAALLARISVFRGSAETYLDHPDQADQSFQTAERMSGTQSPGVMVDLLLGEGKLALSRHDDVKSELLFKRALTIATENRQFFQASMALGNLGVLKVQQDHYADAADLDAASLSAAEKAGAHMAIVRLAVNLGLIYRRMGDLDRASELFEKSEKSAERLGMVDEQTSAILNLGMIEYAQHRLSAAERDYQQALQLARQAEDKPDEIFCLTDLAQVAVEESGFDLAEKYNNQALQLERAIGDHNTELASMITEADISLRRGDRETAERLLRSVVRDRSTDVPIRAWALSIQARMETQRNEFGSAAILYKAAIDGLENERKSLGRDELQLSYPTNARDIYNDYIDFLVGQEKPEEAIRVSESQRARTLTDGLGLKQDSQVFNTAEAQRAAARLGHPILSYWVGTKCSYLWLVLPDRTQTFVLPGEERIRSLAERYRAHLVGGLTGNNVVDADGLELYRILIAPAESWIKPWMSTQSAVTIISDGPLCGLNFETLLVNSPTPHYWIEDVSITNASSAFLLTRGSDAKAAPSEAPAYKLLLIGNPQSPATYPALAHAGEEIKLVGAHFSKDQETVLAGKDATPAAYFKAKPENYSLIHFVAHGTASRVSPLDSAVVLSQDGSSYNLYARDIAANRLHAGLVTISACDSAGARIYSSEGLVGLSWAFLRAGSQRVIASLWEVNDAFTPKLMDRLYSSIAEGEDPAVALRDAKLTLVRSKGVYSRPFYWAAFVLYQGV